MKLMRDRAKAHFPMLLATLLSIVQALALELLWSHTAGGTVAFELTTQSITTIIQLFTTFLVIVLIWVMFASAMMRFQWVPSTIESVYPFILGIIEFMSIKSLGASHPGIWLLLMGVLFAVMIRILHTISRKARHDGGNSEFFDRFKPATWRDFRRTFVMVGTLGILGTAVWLTQADGVFALIAVSVAAAIYCFQFSETARFWDESIGERPFRKHQQ